MERTKSIHEHEDIMKKLGIDTKNLGAVMMPIFDVQLFGDNRGNLLDPEDLYTSPDPAKFWIKGDVTHKAHVTLLYGLLTPAYEQKGSVDKVLRGWEYPDRLEVSEVTVFPSPYEDEKYGCVVAKLDSEEIREAHSRLSYLPHVDTHPRYDPHVTLAYVNEDVAEEWAEVLSWGVQSLIPKGPDYGLDYGENRD